MPNLIIPEKLMSDTDYSQTELEIGELKVVLQFQEESGQDTQIYQDIKSILSAALQEYLSPKEGGSAL